MAKKLLTKEQLLLENEELRKTQTVLEEALLLKNYVFDTSIDANCISDTNGIIKEVNTAFLRIWGYPDKDEVIARPIMDFFENKEEGIAVIIALNTKGEWEGDFTAKRKDKSSFIAPCLGKAVRDVSGVVIGYHLLVPDITGCRQTDKELLESNEELGALYNNAPLPYQSLNEDGSFKDVNPAWLSVLGYRKDEVIGKSFPNFLPLNFLDHFKENFPAFKKRGYVHDVQYKIRHKDGHYLDISFEGSIGYNPDGSFKQTYCVFQDITERKQAEEKRQESEEKFRTLAEFAPVGIYLTNAEGHCTFANPGWLNMVGMDFDEASGSGWTKGLHPDDKDEVLSSLYKSLEERNNWNLDYRFINSQGKITWVTGNAAPIYDSKHNLKGHIGVNIDITYRKQMERQLKEKTFILGERLKELNCLYQIANLIEQTDILIDDFFQKVVSLIPPAFLFPDLTACRIIINDKEFKTNNFKKTEWNISSDIFFNGVKEGSIEIYFLKEIEDSKNEKLVEEEINLLNSIAKQLGQKHERYLNEEIVKFSRAETQQLLSESKRSRRALLSVVEDQKAAENELVKHREQLEEIVEERTDELNTARKAAVAANRAKSTFLSSMSHEIRTPLNAILGFTHLLLREKDMPKNVSERLVTINRSGEHLLALINDILEFSKIEAGYISFDPAPMSLGVMLNDIELMFRAKMENKKVQLVFDIPDSIHENIITDEMKLRQIIINLLGNAEKFTSEGVITLRINQESKKGELINTTIQVEDTGLGISREEISLLFQAFSQTGSGLKKGGTGLGLALSKQYAKLLDGDITVKSEPGKGSCFILNFNAMIGVDSVVKKNVVTRQVTGLMPGQGPFRVLIADDNEDNRALLKELLVMVGFQIEEAADGNEAVEKYKTFNPHIILMDMRMPILSGYEAIVKIKNIKGGEDIPIIAVTASAFEEDRDKTINWGADGYLRKPFRVYELYDCLKNFLDIEYVYDDENIIEVSGSSEESPILSPESLKDMSDDMIDDMIQATINLDQDCLLELIDLIKEKNPAIAESLMKLVKLYEYDILIQLLKSRKGVS